MTSSRRGAEAVLAADDLLCFAVYAAGLAFNRAYREPLQAIGLTYPQYLVMVTLWSAGEPLTVGEIGSRLGLDSNTLTPLLKRLEALGHVARRRSVEDERRVVVTLTPRGRGLRVRARGIPTCIAHATGLNRSAIADLTVRLRDLRSQLEAATAPGA